MRTYNKHRLNIVKFMVCIMVHVYLAMKYMLDYLYHNYIIFNDVYV